MSALVYLHIPKTAGTSHREYLAKVYGEEAIFWYGLNSDSEKFSLGELSSAKVVGGHKPLGFYPKSFQARYTAMLRDPVERAVSFFNYCAAPPSAGTAQWIKEREAELRRWRARGVDPSSMVRSIENCKDFRREIQNFQCHYLSRHGATFSGVRKTLHEVELVLGLMEELQRFNEFFQSEFLYPIDNNYKVNVGSTGYSADVLAEPGLVKLIRSLNVEDQRLYDFVRFEHRGLYIGVENLSEVRKRISPLKPQSDVSAPAGSVEPLHRLNWKKVHLFSKGLVTIFPGQLKIPLIIQNGTEQTLVLSQEENVGCAIGWQFKDGSGKIIAALQGVVHVAQIIPPGHSRPFVLELSIEDQQLRDQIPHTVEFSIVDDKRWVRDEHPMSSSWAIVLTEHPGN